MKYLLLTLFVFSVTHATANDNEKKAARYMKQLGLSKEEMYVSSKAELAGKYGKSGSLDFPNNHVYNNEGQEIMALYGERQVPMLDCFSAMVRDLNRYINDTGGVVYTQVNTTLQSETQYFKPVYGQEARKQAQHTVLLYYPSGLPMIKKYYRNLAKTIARYRKQDKDIAIYFVMVPLK